MQARKRWKQPTRDTSVVKALAERQTTAGYRRPDGSIDLHRFRAEYLQTHEECIIVMGELDKLREHFAYEVRFMRATLAKTAKYANPELYRSCTTLWNLAKTARNQVQDRRGQLRRETRAELAQSREQAFVGAARRLLPKDLYFSIWQEVDQSTNHREE